MNAPKRIKDDPRADPALAALLRQGSPPRPLDSETFERSRRRVLSLGAAPAALGVVFWIKNAALGAVLGTVAVAAVAVPSWLEGPVPASSAAPPTEAPSAPRTAPPLSPPLEAPSEPSPGPAPSRAPAPSAAASLETSNHLARESALLESARASLEQNPAGALRLLAEHGREFPNGALSVEREFLTVAGLVRLGRWPEARARAASLRARAPGSLYEERLAKILGDADGAP